MLPELQAMSPDERLAAGRCPECGVALKGLDTMGERDRHWPKAPPNQPESKEAGRRYQMLTDLAVKQAQDAAVAAARAAKKEE